MNKMDKEEIIRQLDDAIRKHDRGAIIMAKLPTESYMSVNALLVDAMTSKTYECIYISLRTPFEQTLSTLSKTVSSKNKLFFIASDAKASAKCIPLKKNPDIGEIIWAVEATLPKLISMKKFIFLDSLSSISDSQPLAEVLKLSEYLSRLMRKREIEGLILVFDSKYANNAFVKDVALKVDEVLDFSK